MAKNSRKRAAVWWCAAAVGGALVVVAGAAGLRSARSASARGAATRQALEAVQGEIAHPRYGLQGVDGFGQKLFFSVGRSQPSPCGKAQSLLDSFDKDPTCPRSRFAVRYLVKLVKAGLVESEIKQLLDRRYSDGPVRTFDLTQAPLLGDPTARVVLVEFSDFECPHCRRTAPVLRQVVTQYRGKVKLYFKNFPLSSHPHAKDAAAAAVAAGKQGKFWELHDQLYAHQEQLDRVSIERYAQTVGVNLPRFKADWLSSGVTQVVARDRAEGEKLDVKGTPTVYLNGREYTDPQTFEELKDWLDEELELGR
jgi:protein-disulfide isomerase